MQSFLQTPTLNSQPLRLAEEQQQNPQEVFTCFFDAYALAAAKQYLADCVEIALTTDNLLYDQLKDRADLFHFYHFMEEVLEAAHVLVGRQQRVS